MKVSIITPTTNDRAEFNTRLKVMVNKQDYRNWEHIMLFDEGVTIGEKRNRLCSMAKGEIIVMMDSDDLYAKDYVSKCVEQLKECDVTGCDKSYFSDGQRAWLWEWKGGQKLVCGSGMAFWRRVWENNQFKHVNSGEDTIFCANAGKIVPHGYLNGFIATIHEKNTASHHAIPFMKEVDINLIPNLEAFQ